MLDKERNRSTSYSIRVNISDPLSCRVSIYPRLVHHHHPYPGGGKASNTVTGNFRYDALPKWMADAMRMLDAAAVDGYADIPDFGLLSKDVYWFMADQTK